MAFSSSTILSVVELAAYLIVTPLVVFLAVRHRLNGVLGHLFLAIFCTLRVAAAIIAIVHRTEDASVPSTGSSILSAIGLSPLLLALSGFIHESHHYQVTAGHTKSSARHLQFVKWLWVAQVGIHFVGIAGVAMAASGGANFSTATSHKEINKDNIEREAGSSLLFALWLVLFAYAGFVWHRIRNTADVARTNLSSLATCTLLGSVFVGIRATYSLVYSIDHSPSINPVTGKFSIKLILVFLVQLIAVLLLVAGSWGSKGIAQSQPVSLNESKDLNEERESVEA